MDRLALNVCRRPADLRWSDALAFADVIEDTRTRLPYAFCDMLREKVQQQLATLDAEVAVALACMLERHDVMDPQLLFNVGEALSSQLENVPLSATARALSSFRSLRFEHLPLQDQLAESIVAGRLSFDGADRR